MTAAAASPSEISAADPGDSRRAMFRRLRGYLAQNRGRYALGALLLLGYDAGFVVVPLLVGWSIQAVADGLPVQEVGRRAAILGLVTLVRMILRFASRITMPCDSHHRLGMTSASRFLSMPGNSSSA